MKILMTSDIHCNDKPYIIAKENLDKVDLVVFPGDYFDSHIGLDEGDRGEQNFEKYISLKKENPNKVKMLLGNHDIWYLTDYPYSSAGHRPEKGDERKKLLSDNISLFDCCVIQDKWIFSHAGIGQRWLNSPNDLATFLVARDLEDVHVLEKNWKLEELNDRIKNPDYWPNFDHLSNVGDGDSPLEGPCWIRVNALLNVGVKGYNQCVGHTPYGGAVIPIAKIMAENPGYEKMFEGREECTYVLTDSPDQSIAYVVDTISNEVTKLD